jgi:ABC-type transport system involved in multi-copper enzyme maturation permease subunit
MKTNIRYILLTALRDWLFAGLLFGVVLCALISGAMGNMAMVEPEQLKLVYSAASVRLVLVVGLIVFICFHVRNGFDTKEIDVFLSRPISRPNLVISYWLGFSVVASLLVLPTIGIVYFVGMLDQKGFTLWALSLILEILLVVAVALFSAFTLKSAVSSVMASLGFYVLSRMMGFFIATSNSSLLFRSSELNNFSQFLMEHLAIFVPRLDFFAKTEWLVYGVASPDDARLFTLQAAIFIPLLLAATIIDFRRKQF